MNADGSVHGFTPTRAKRLAGRDVVLALDTGLDCGWAVGLIADIPETEVRARVPISGCVTLKENAHQGGGVRYLLLRRFLQRVKESIEDAGGRLAAMAWERAMPLKNGHHAARTAAGMEAIASCWAEECGIPWIALNVARIRVRVFGRSMGKEEAFAAIVAMGFRTSSQDEGDAIAVALAATGELAPVSGKAAERMAERMNGTATARPAICPACKASISASAPST